VLHSQDYYNELFPVNVPTKSLVHVQVIGKVLNITVNGQPTVTNYRMISTGDQTFVGLGAYYGLSGDVVNFKNLRIRRIAQ